MQSSIQTSLFAVAETPRWRDLGELERRVLTRGAWVDHLTGWLAGADDLFESLRREVPWRDERRQMYDREVAVPRCLAFYGRDDALPDPLLDEARDLLNTHHGTETFETAGLCLYRDGRDSVAWHGDRIGRGRSQDTMVAILSLGETRRLLLRPDPNAAHADTEGAPGSLALPLAHGDLVVMGGSCQRTWQHAIPKSTVPCGPRISVQFRPAGVL